MAAYDSSNNIDAGGIYDTAYFATDNFYIAIDRDSLDYLKWGLDSDTSSLANTDSSILLSGKGGSGSVIDTSNSNNDSTIVKIAEAERGTYFAYQQRILGAWTFEWSEWVWWSPPDSAGTFVCVADDDADSIDVSVTGQPLIIDSLEFLENGSVSWTLTDTLPSDTTVYTSNGGSEVVCGLKYYLNGTNSWQAGWDRDQTDTCNPTAGGATPQLTLTFEDSPASGATITANGSNSFGDTRFHDGDTSGVVVGSGGAGNYFSCVITSSHVTADSGTFDGWFWFVDTPANFDAVFKFTNVDGDWVDLMFHSSDELTMEYKDAGNNSWTLVTTAINVPTGQWTRITTSWKVGGTPTMSLTVDGTTETSSAAIELTSNFTELRISGDPAGRSSVGGNVDEINLYTTVETQ